MISKIHYSQKKGWSKAVVEEYCKERGRKHARTCLAGHRRNFRSESENLVTLTAFWDRNQAMRGPEVGERVIFHGTPF